MTFITRFAPSPTGPLHLGHAYSALLAQDMARAEGGDFLLRIEDIDQSRARDHWEAQIYQDLSWLGLCWPTPVLRQSDQKDRYRAALDYLWASGVLYPCTCSRRDIEAATSAPQEGAPLYGPDGAIYPQTCKGNMAKDQIVAGQSSIPEETAIRLDMQRACAFSSVAFTETGYGPNGETGRIEFTAQQIVDSVGDIVLSRRGMGTSYHLSVVLDDAAQGVTHVVRGEDLFEATKIHVVLQRLLGLPTPTYHHHKLMRDGAGKRLAKRDDARAIAKYRAEGASPQDIRKMVGLD
ncbi:MAG: tRNA glutamyl-Q(34) synthetase GluQRS [Rhodobacteraceae bacterium]|nr:tRNA glutamyl-Q(34) synthetase GluQRS [Paracoccaceae bacterium]